MSGNGFKVSGMNETVVRKVAFSDLQVRGGSLYRTKLYDVELCDLEIHGEVRNVVVNGVDIAPLIDAELNRRTPERAKMRPSSADEYREAWEILERLWAGTVERAKTFSEDDLHRNVGEEWSFVQTLRHLCFASDAWVGRMILGDPSPWHPLDLPWDEAPGWPGIPWDREARPPFDEVLALRAERQAMVRKVIASLTDEQLASTVTQTAPGWPIIEDFPLQECLQIVLIEEWEHRQYAERDLTVLEG